MYEARAKSNLDDGGEDDIDSDNGLHTKTYYKSPGVTVRELEVIKESSQSSSENDLTFTRWLR